MVSREEAAQVKDRHSDALLMLPGVVGVGVTQDDAGQYALTIHVETIDPKVCGNLPDQIEGCSVRIVESGKYRKL